MSPGAPRSLTTPRQVRARGPSCFPVKSWSFGCPGSRPPYWMRLSILCGHIMDALLCLPVESIREACTFLPSLSSAVTWAHCSSARSGCRGHWGAGGAGAWGQSPWGSSPRRLFWQRPWVSCRWAGCGHSPAVLKEGFRGELETRPSH